MNVGAGKKGHRSLLKVLPALAAIGLLAGMLTWRYGVEDSLAYETVSDNTVRDDTVRDNSVRDDTTTADTTGAVKNQTREIREVPSSSCEAVVKSAGEVVNISRPQQPGEGNKYVCYYEEGDEQLSLLFRIQREYALPEEKTTVVLKWNIISREGISQTDILPGEVYTLQPEVKLTEFPVVIPPEPAGDEDIDYGLSQDEGLWYELTIPFTQKGLTAAAADGKTLIISTGPGGGADSQALPTREDAVPAEIRLVMRNQFDLD